MFKFNNYKTISLIDKKEWDNCSGKVNPFLSYTFLKNLEDSKSIGPNTSWIPNYISVELRQARPAAEKIK